VLATLGFPLMTFGLIESTYMNIGTPIRSVSLRNFNAILKSTQKFCLSGGFDVKKKHLLDTDKPYNAPMGLLEPKPEPVEDMIAPHEFMYRRKGIFDEDSS